MVQIHPDHLPSNTFFIIHKPKNRYQYELWYKDENRKDTLRGYRMSPHRANAAIINMSGKQKGSSYIPIEAERF